MQASGGSAEAPDFEVMSKKIGSAWQELTEEDREVYYTIAKEEHKKYHEEMKVYNDIKVCVCVCARGYGYRTDNKKLRK